MKDVLREFLLKVSQDVATLDATIARFEKNPDDVQSLDKIFYLVKTIKDACGYVELFRLKQMTCTGNSIVHHGKLTVVPEIVRLVLKSLDTIRSLMSHLEKPEADLLPFTKDSARDCSDENNERTPEDEVRFITHEQMAQLRRLLNEPPVTCGAEHKPINEVCIKGGRDE
jgi:chemotaxis protein histidine kinase CheA